MFTEEEKRYITNCVRWNEDGNTHNFWVKLIAKMWEVIITLQEEIEKTRDKGTEEALQKKGT